MCTTGGTKDCTHISLAVFLGGFGLTTRCAYDGAGLLFAVPGPVLAPAAALGFSFAFRSVPAMPRVALAATRGAAAASVPFSLHSNIGHAIMLGRCGLGVYN